MATIVQNLAPLKRNGSTANTKAVTETILTASDTFLFSQGTGQILVLRNITAGSLTVTLNGSGNSANQFIEGYPNTDFTTGYSTGVIAAGASVLIPLDTIALYLQGTITVTGGTGISAYIINFS